MGEQWEGVEGVAGGDTSDDPRARPPPRAPDLLTRPGTMVPIEVRLAQRATSRASDPSPRGTIDAIR